MVAGLTGPVLPGDCRLVMADMEPDSIDAIVCDPPYEINFMSHKWDRSQVAFDPETWQAAWRVLKPGAYALIFGGTRTYHRMVTAVEDAGFEIVNCICWLNAEGMPKGWNFNNRVPEDAWCDCASASARDGGVCVECGKLHPDFRGFDSSLKPGLELVCMARKPFTEKTILKNVLAHGVGAINIEKTRIQSDAKRVRPSVKRTDNQVFGKGLGAGTQVEPDGGFPGNVALDEAAARLLNEQARTGRAGEASAHARYEQTGATNFARTPGIRGGSPDGGFPGNVALDEETARELDAQSGIRKSGAMSGSYQGFGTTGIYSPGGKAERRREASAGGASRFFFCAKSSQKERNLGMPEGQTNTHATVKPLALMRWLVTLVTPPGGTVLDPFCGSGSTGCAAESLGFTFVGIDLNYADLANTRILALRKDAE